VRKTSSWQAPETSETQIVLNATLDKHLEKSQSPFLVQRFIKSKGSKAAVYRAKWRRDKPFFWVNIISGESISEAINSASIDVVKECREALEKKKAAAAAPKMEEKKP
jgi:hypothetical protein